MHKQCVELDFNAMYKQLITSNGERHTENLSSKELLEIFSAGILLRWRSCFGPQQFPGQILMLPGEADPNSAALIALNLRLQLPREGEQTDNVRSTENDLFLLL